MEKDDIFEAWAPAGGVWSPWVKPVLFSFLPRPAPGSPPPSIPTEAIRAPDERVGPAAAPRRLGFTTQGVPPPGERQALLVELPGPLAVTAGLALAEMGYRPVPLFNACPPPLAEGGVGLAPAAVDVDAVLTELVRGAERLRMAPPPRPDAPPAFLVDADRQTPRIPFAPGVFDNRSAVFPTDFPSAAFVMSQAITGAVLLRERDRPVAWDLARVLREWRRAGLELRAWRQEMPGAPTPLALPRMWFLADWWNRLWASLNLRPNPLGGYGRLLTESSGG